MALVNALFPANVEVEDSEDCDPTPYTVGLKGTIRFTLFEHLLKDEPFSKSNFDILHMKLHKWYDMLQYEDSRHALLRYTEESKKLEEACLSLLDTIERKGKAHSYGTTGSHSSKSKKKSSTESKSQSDGTTFVESKDFDLAEALRDSKVPMAPPVPNPLIRNGLPGREIVGAHTNPAAFAGSTFGEKEKHRKCGRLSKTEFHRHPLAKELGLTSSEMAMIGLVLPKEFACQGP